VGVLCSFFILYLIVVQSLGVLANLAENLENMKPMVESGCLQRLK
jgi:hypothetical protein